MPAIDAQTDELILRIAYDGASRAGKTTNLTQLSQKLDSEIAAPEQDGERTVYFDWMRYRAGNYRGRPIRCELLSAPGQELLAQRRDLLLSTADAIVLVLDASNYQLDSIKTRVKTLRSTSSTQTPPAVLVQANKCDLAPDATLQDLQEFCKSHDPPLMFSKSTALTGEGVRETFVLAVRMAVLRAHALRRKGLEFPAASTMEAETMLKWLRTQESLNKIEFDPLPPESAAQSEIEQAHGGLTQDDTALGEAVFGGQASGKQAQVEQALGHQAHLASHSAKDEHELQHIERTIDAMRAPGSQLPENPDQPSKEELPDPPRADVPEGMVWPPVTGRSALADICAQPIEVEAVSHGGFFASVKNCWELHSAADAVFHSPVTGMEQLLEWARQHSDLSEVLSGPRCIVFSPVDNRQTKTNHAWRLWQIVRVHRPVRDTIASLLDEEDPYVIAESLISAGACILTLESRRQEYPLLPECRLDSVGERLNGAHFVGLLPGPKALNAGLKKQRPTARELLARELTEVVLQDWRDNGNKIAKEIKSLARDFHDPRKKLAAQTLTEVLTEQRQGSGPIRLFSRALRRR